MKDIKFTVKQQKREIVYILVCLLLAFVINIISIMSYQTEWKELYTQWFPVLILTFLFYFLFTVIRLIINLLRFKKK